MTLTFFSNFLNLHQLPFCLEIIEHIGEENFRFVATSKIAQDRIAMGFEDMNTTKPFVVRAYEGGRSYEEAVRLAIESDVAIMGSAPLEYTEKRMKTNRLTFQYSERLLKRGWRVLLMPGFYRSHYRQFLKYRNKEMYVLCASAYTAPDLEKLWFPREKCFKWGYFPDVAGQSYLRKYGESELRHRQGVSILWAGRLIGWKHPEAAIRLAKELDRNGYDFSMKIIGDGELRPNLESLITEYSLSEKIQMLGSKPHEAVMDEMKNADIFVFTSDRNEGWGAVLNEAMAAGCAVVASDAIGSAPFLIEDGINGFLYEDGNIQSLYNRVIGLIESPETIRILSSKAIETIRGEWSIMQATNNLFSLIESLTTGKLSPIKRGPCSPA